MSERIRLSRSEILRLEYAVTRLETLGPLTRPLSVARVSRQGAEHFYVLREPAVIDPLRAIRTKVERDGAVAALVNGGAAVWFNAVSVSRQRSPAIALYVLEGDGQNRELVRVEPERGRTTSSLKKRGPKATAYPLRDGKYLVDRSRLSARLLLVLNDLLRLDSLARDSRKLIQELEAQGKDQLLISSHKRATIAYERTRDLHVGRLWTMMDERPPRGVRFQDLEIVEAEPGAMHHEAGA